MPYLTVGGCRIAYDREGSGPPLVLVHGAAQDGTVWRHVLPELARHFDVVALDQPGHGKSQLWRGEPIRHVAGFAEVLGEFIRALGLGPAFVVGHSLGGAVMLRTALDHPRAVAAGVNIAGSASSADARIGYSYDLLRLISVNPTDWMETIFYSVTRSSHVTPEQRWEWAFESRRIPPECLMGDLHAYTSCAFLDELARVDVAVLSVAGEYDWTCAPERVRATSDRLGSGTFQLLEGVGHMPHLEVPEQLARRLLDFFASCVRGASR